MREGASGPSNAATADDSAELDQIPPISGAGDSTGRRAVRRREREILEVLLRHGLGFLAEILGFEHVLAAEARGRARKRSGLGPPEVNLRRALEELGPTYIKLGQLLSTRADLLPAGYRRELEKLQDAAPAVDPAVIEELVAHELGEEIAAAFQDFDREPLAAGSIGQAHAATLRDGRRVVVKLRRPGVVERVQLDLEVLQNCAARADRHWGAAEPFDIPALTEEFAHDIRVQLDYLQEGRNAERFAANFAGEESVRIPEVFWAQTTSRMITLERVGGIKVTDVEALEAAGVDRAALARRAADISAKMVFEDGWFHGDPHPGNFFVETSGRIGVIDFGIVGALDDHTRSLLLALLVAVSRRDADRVARCLVELGASSTHVDRPALRDDLAPLLERYVGRTVGAIDLGGAIRETLEVARRHQLRVPRDLALLLRTILLEEGIVEQLDPGFSLTEALAPYARRQILGQLSPEALNRRLREAGGDLFELAAVLPDQLHRALKILADGEFEVHLRAAELEPLVARVERVGRRIAWSVAAAAASNVALELLATRSGARAEGHDRPRRLGAGGRRRVRRPRRRR